MRGDKGRSFWRLCISFFYNERCRFEWDYDQNVYFQNLDFFYFQLKFLTLKKYFKLLVIKLFFKRREILRKLDIATFCKKNIL